MQQPVALALHPLVHHAGLPNHLAVDGPLLLGEDSLGGDGIQHRLPLADQPAPHARDDKEQHDRRSDTGKNLYLPHVALHGGTLRIEEVEGQAACVREAQREADASGGTSGGGAGVLGQFQRGGVEQRDGRAHARGERSDDGGFVTGRARDEEFCQRARRAEAAVAVQAADGLDSRSGDEGFGGQALVWSSA